MLLESLYRTLVRPALFTLDAERAHTMAAAVLRATHAAPDVCDALARYFAPPASLGVTALGKRFASPLLVAAGFDKGAEMYDALFALGFGGVEIGTVTAHPQPGNPRPRLFRLREDRAVINRMGFNNAGAMTVAHALTAHPPATRGVLGVNLGKSRVTSLDDAAEDYARSARLLGAHAGYLVINVSSPNTPGLRALQSVDALGPVLSAVQRELVRLATPPPLLVKIAPDLADEDIDAVADLAVARGLAGLIAANTTIRRDGLRTADDVVARAGAGGLSGPPLRQRAIAIVRRIRQRVGTALTLIAAGGIETGDDAWEALEAGASLVQVYTALIYRGPTLAASMHATLARRLAERGGHSLADLAVRTQ